MSSAGAGCSSLKTFWNSMACRFRLWPRTSRFTLSSFVEFFISFGAFVRPAALVVTINFIAALLIAHIGLSFEQSFDAWIMLCGSTFFLFYGAGKISIDY
jgi:hypothetical protein